MSTETVQRAVGGDRGACQELVRLHGPVVYGLCRRLCSDPDDAYQAVWEKVFAALPRFQVGGPASFRGWLSTVTRRYLVDRHRRRLVRGPSLPVEDLVSSGLGPDAAVERQELHEALDHALQHLPPEQRVVVVSHHVHGLALEELARESGVPVGTVKSRLHRGRARLVQLLRSSP